MQFIIQHVIGALSASAIIGGIVAWIAKELPAFSQKEVALFNAKMLANIKDPKLKQFCVDVDAAAAKAIPDAGDSVYSALADKILAECPAEAIAARPILIAVLSGIGSGAKQGLSQ